jgi:CHAD domain-containing protein
MSFRIEAGETQQAALRRIACEEIEAALDEIGDDALGPHETVHEVRKHCKRVRGLLRLQRGAFAGYSDENASLRDAARPLSAVRDAAALIEACDALAARFCAPLEADAIGALRDALITRRDALSEEMDLSARLSETAESLRSAAERIGGWHLDASGFDAFGDGLERVHRRARRAMQRAQADPSDARLHEWRKRVKYHRYHLRLLHDLWPPVMAPLRDAAKLLSDRLGDDHDLAVLRHTILEEPLIGGIGDREMLLALIDRRRVELLAWSRPVGLRLLAQPSGSLRRQIRALWEAWQVDQRLDASLPHGSESVG